ncbi:hypothetical protein A8C56_01285 [Niabella ginsenosidivorans]|uniref:DUF2089 domain-containing protein n=1 Tax=Niabella ginsenosidivorans TaxID=1176587 RepID=A0A1A9HZN8_9BACT|nr:DUF2089 family protein [Niabella ginsenosidivorans]ANH79784.1 hypothetical protein A8C56_01285 [Niabella ginsenosidivorans]
MKLPIHCPSCKSPLKVSQLKCEACSTQVSGLYELPLYLKLSQEEQGFIMEFFLASGSIKEMARQAGTSYPTMRNKMDDMIEKIKKMTS